ncbi:MAG: peptidase, partial [Eubacteriales bacterium]|nr:peptidase [Eubacteriales bacterium]
MRKGNFRRVLSGLLAMMTVMTTVMSPMVTYAQEADPADKKPPLYKEVKDMLDEDEVVKAEDLELDFGSRFDIKIDFTKIEIPNNDKVKVTFEEAKNEAGEDFTTEKADTYKAVYYVEPLTTDHPKYQISRNLIVKEAPQTEAQTEIQSESQDNGGDSGSGEEVDDGESDSETEAFMEAQVGIEALDFDAENEASTEMITEAAETEEMTEAQTEIDETEAESEAETEYVENEEELALDADLEASEDQDVYDEESGLYLSDVMEELVEAEDVDLLAMEEGEVVSVMLLAASDSTKSTQSVDVVKGTSYHYADYGLGSYQTHKYTVTFGSVTATAYCVQPSKGAPGDGRYTITKLSDGKTLAKVCYYGTKASGDEGFFAEKYPDFSAGKRFVITHIAAAYANGSSDWDSGTNSEGRKLAMELYNYCVSMPEIPDVAMSFSEDNVKAYVDGNIQRTKEIKFKADELQTVTFKLPAGVKLVNTSTGKTSAAGASVEISGGTSFYLTAPLTQASDVSATFSTTMKGSITKDYSAYKITTTSGDQDLALV